ncbi:unnamed protein product [Microthlaspi erraticum]|uniref:F-box domain-containing protein n=1 Tax=Microthlaspi erraticum TaxID=1685480 RepID=A0A6D2IHW5_9BRAS|nr:unnamed protein product [Microthlaspi erraticum]
MMMNSIPIDLLHEIFSRLPAKSTAKCLQVSKQWESILCRPDFTELFLTRSSTRPRLLFAIRGPQNGEWSFFSSPQPQNPYEKSQSSLAVTADSHIKFPAKISLPLAGYASGLICFGGVRFSKDSKYIGNVICNPSTGHYALLPKLNSKRS